jgi:hypothetical protein
LVGAADVDDEVAAEVPPVLEPAVDPLPDTAEGGAGAPDEQADSRRPTPTVVIKKNPGFAIINSLQAFRDEEATGQTSSEQLMAHRLHACQPFQYGPVGLALKLPWIHWPSHPYGRLEEDPPTWPGWEMDDRLRRRWHGRPEPSASAEARISAPWTTNLKGLSNARTGRREARRVHGDRRVGQWRTL